MNANTEMFLGKARALIKSNGTPNVVRDLSRLRVFGEVNSDGVAVAPTDQEAMLAAYLAGQQSAESKR